MHESGIHVSGLLRDPMNYQFLDPAAFGRVHQIVLGKHSGAATVQWAYNEMGISVDSEEAREILLSVRAHYLTSKAPPTKDELRHFHRAAKRRTVPVPIDSIADLGKAS